MKNNELIVHSVSIQGSAQLIPFKTHRPWNVIKKALRGKSPVFVEEQNPFISYQSLFLLEFLTKFLGKTWSLIKVSIHSKSCKISTQTLHCP